MSDFNPDTFPPVIVAAIGATDPETKERVHLALLRQLDDVIYIPALTKEAAIKLADTIAAAIAEATGMERVDASADYASAPDEDLPVPNAPSSRSVN